MNTAIIVAAGQGTRFGGTKPKQFHDLAGKPVLLHTLARFEDCPEIHAIVIVLPGDGYEKYSVVIDSARAQKLKAVARGGTTRAESVRNGFLQVDYSGVVAIHDGARPLVTSDEITQTVLRAEEMGAACLVAELTDTIKVINNDNISRTVDRRSLRRALTPQAFRYEVFEQMMALDLTDDNTTDECFLAEKLGVPIACVEGSSRNIKITHSSDLTFAEILLAETNHAESVS